MSNKPEIKPTEWIFGVAAAALVGWGLIEIIKGDWYGGWKVALGLIVGGLGVSNYRARNEAEK